MWCYEAYSRPKKDKILCDVMWKLQRTNFPQSPLISQASSCERGEGPWPLNSTPVGRMTGNWVSGTGTTCGRTPGDRLVPGTRSYRGRKFSCFGSKNRFYGETLPQIAGPALQIITIPTKFKRRVINSEINLSSANGRFTPVFTPHLRQWRTGMGAPQ